MSGAEGSGNDVANHRDEMADTAAKDAEVPDHVEVGDAIPGVEGDAAGVEETAGDKPGETGDGEDEEKRFDSEDDEPSHADVEGGGESVEASGGKSLEDDAENGDGPDDGEEGPAQAAAEEDKGERRVGSGDQQIDRTVIEDAEDAAGAR